MGKVEIYAKFGSEQQPGERLNDDEALRRQVAAGGMGCSTYWFVKRCMRDPALRARIQARAAEIRANGEYGLGST